MVEIELPASIITRLVEYGARTEPGRLMLGTVLLLHPDVQEAVAAQDGQYRIEVIHAGRLVPGVEPAASTAPDAGG